MGEVIPKNILIGNVGAVSISSRSLHIIYVMTRPAAGTGRAMYECGDGRTITMLFIVQLLFDQDAKFDKIRTIYADLWQNGTKLASWYLNISTTYVYCISYCI